jgi:HlyD family secretion protein
MATGYIQPVDEVEVGTQVSGVIENLYADYNSHVKKGQLLAELDKLTLNEKLHQATAQLNSAKSDLALSNQQYNRVKQLHEAKAATDVALEEAVNRKAQAETAMEDAQANLSQAQVNLSYASIYSPIDGVVLKRAVNKGQTVAAMFSTPTLFTIAEDLTKMQVEADVDEADIGQVKLSQHVVFTVDAYPGESFNGTVSQIRISPKVTNNVVTYTVIVDAPNPEEKLFPGMTASIRINIQSEEGILVPMDALSMGKTLRVKSNGQIEERDIQTGINDGVSVIARSGIAEGEEVIVSEK